MHNVSPRETPPRAVSLPPDVARLVDALPQWVFAIDRRHTYTFVNAAYAAYLHRRPDEFIGRTYRDFFAPEVAARFEAANAAAMDRGTPCEEDKVVGASEQMCLKAPLRNDVGEVVGLIGIFTDITRRKQLERELKDSHARFDAFMEALPAVAFIKDAAGRNVFLNAFCQRLLGAEPNRGVGRKPDDYLPREEAAAIRESDLRLAQTLTPQSLQQRLTVNGVERVFQTHKFPVFRTGQAPLFGGVAVDITDLDASRRALQASEERYRSVVTSMAEGVVLQTADGTIIAHNDQAEKILGLTRDQLLGRTLVDLARMTLRPDGRPFPGEEHPGMITLRTGQPCRNQVMGIRVATGATRWININTEPVFYGPPDQPHGVVASFGDITDRVERENRLRASERRLHRVLEVGEFGIWEYDFAAQQAVSSPRYARIFGYLQPDPCWSLPKFFAHVLPEDRPEVMRHSDLSRPEKIVPEFECRIRRADGAIRWIRVWREVEYSSDGRPLFLRGMIRDITGRKEEEAVRARHERARQKANQLESMVGITRGVAHDFNNALGAVRTAADLIASARPDSPVFRECLGVIREAVRQATGLTSQMLAFAGPASVATETVALRAIVEQCQDDLLELAAGRVGLQWELEPDSPAIQADPAQVRLLVANVVANAIEACLPAGGTVTVRTGCRTGFTPTNLEAANLADPAAADYLFLEVRDSGVGISRADRARMYEPFFSTKFVGRGLGLAAVAGIVRALHGAIAVESSEGRGTAFTVYLPVDAPRATVPGQPAEAPPGAAAGEKGTILVVDDDPNMRLTTTLALESRGYAVVAAGDGEEALGAFTADPAKFEAVILDLSMPKLDGDRIFEAMLQVKPGVRVVIMSGYFEDQVASRLRGKRPLAILRKPFEVEELFRALGRSPVT